MKEQVKEAEENIATSFVSLKPPQDPQHMDTWIARVQPTLAGITITLQPEKVAGIVHTMAPRGMTNAETTLVFSNTHLALCAVRAA